MDIRNKYFDESEEKLESEEIEKEVEYGEREEDSDHETEELLYCMLDGWDYCYCIKHMNWK